MSELLHESISLVNLPYTVLFVLVLVYWILYIVGAVGSDTLEAIDLDLDVSVDGDADLDGDVVHGAGLMTSVLSFFYLGEIPVTVIFSILFVFLWAFSMVVNHATGNASGWIALILFPLNLFVGLSLTKLILMPFAPLLARFFDQAGDKIELIGKRCVVSSLEVTPQHGQAEVTTKGAPLLLNVKCTEGDCLKRGEEAVIYDQDEEHNTYLIRKLDF